MDDLKNYITRLREDFMHGSLDESEINKDPSVQFIRWLQQAVDSKIPEVQAMILATVSEDGKPSSRVVYLREFDNNGYSFYTNYNSRKSKELEKNPFASLTFFWPGLERQIRIEGKVEKVSAKQSDAYYNSRPYDSKIGAWASNQSEPLSSRQELEKKVEELKKQRSPESILRPEFWGGFVLKANYYEFWQGRKSRLHDRISYSLKNNSWIISRLAP
jgi:pyridoxamine 5'-phosphate oxidase